MHFDSKELTRKKENAPRRVSLARGHQVGLFEWNIDTSTRTSVALDSSALRKSSAAQRTAQPARSEVERPRRYGLEVKRAWERPACAVIADHSVGLEEEGIEITSIEREVNSLLRCEVVVAALSGRALSAVSLPRSASQ